MNKSHDDFDKSAPKNDPSRSKVKDLDEMKKLIADKEKEILRVRGDYFRLVEQFKTQVKDRQILVESLTNEDAKNMKLMLQLQNKIHEAEKVAEKSLHEAHVEKDSEISKLRKAGNEQLRSGDVKVDELKEDMKSMEDIFKKMSIYEIQCFEWNQNCIRTQQKITKLKYDNQIEMAKMKQQIESEFDERLDQFKQEASQDAQRNILEIEKNIHLENEKLNMKTVSQRANIDYYKKEISQLKELNKNFKRDININQGTEQEYIKRQQQQFNKIQSYKQKISILEKSLQQIVGDFEKEKEMVRYQHEFIIKEQRQQILNARENLRVKNNEFRQVKALAQVILDQRSEVEQFFLEALEQIKEEIRKKAQIEKRMRKNGQEPPVEQKSTNQNPGEKVDLNDLEWEDRERVLRLLFSKMNAGVVPTALLQRANIKKQAKRQQEMRQISEMGVYLEQPSSEDPQSLAAIEY